MKYSAISHVQKEVSRLIFGTASIAKQEERASFELLDSVLESGINTLDTARVYLKSEEILGKWMEKRENRESIVLLSKCAHPSLMGFGRKRVSEKDIRIDFAHSAELLKTDKIDIYLLHRDDERVPAGDIVEIMNALVAEGKISAFGGSNWRYERIAEANEYAYKHGLYPFSASSPNYSLADQLKDPDMTGCISICGERHRAAREWYEKNNIAVVAYAALAGGFLSGKLKSADAANAKKYIGSFAAAKYVSPENLERLRRCERLAEKKGATVSQTALAWLLAESPNCFAVVSASRPERIKENARALDIELSAEEKKYLSLEE